MIVLGHHISQLVYRTLPAVLVFTLSCNSPQKQKAKAADSPAPQPKNVAAVSSIDNIKQLRKIVAVINRNGASLRESPDAGSREAATCLYGQSLEVTRVAGKWLEVRGDVALEDGEQHISVDGLYIERSQVGNYEDLKLTTTDLAYVTDFDTGEDADNKSRLEQTFDYLKMEVIDKSLYDSKKKQAVTIYVDEEDKDIELDGVVHLKNGTDWTDHHVPEVIDHETIYKYCGQIPFINQYVIFGGEEGTFYWVDKDTRKETFSSDLFPNLSPDKQIIITHNQDKTVEGALVGVYELRNGTYVNTFNAHYGNWIPYDYPEGFWTKDNWYYLRVYFSIMSCDMEGYKNMKITPEYIRMRVL